jgi:hypothetical protein
LPLKRIPAVQFTYDLWRAGSLSELGIKQREWSIKAHRNYIKNMAVGYAEAEKLHVRPKKNCIAVMFFYNDKHFWTHLTNKEFIICFPEYEKYLQSIKS